MVVDRIFSPEIQGSPSIPYSLPLNATPLFPRTISLNIDNHELSGKFPDGYENPHVKGLMEELHIPEIKITKNPYSHCSTL